jgi:hypothetical protein
MARAVRYRQGDIGIFSQPETAGVPNPAENMIQPVMRIGRHAIPEVR